MLGVLRVLGWLGGGGGVVVWWWPGGCMLPRRIVNMIFLKHVIVKTLTRVWGAHAALQELGHGGRKPLARAAQTVTLHMWVM